MIKIDIGSPLYKYEKKGLKMDVVNNLEIMIPKMRKQLYLKKVYSLDVFYESIEKEGQYLNIRNLDTFLAKFGIFLKSQEITALLNLLCFHREKVINNTSSG